MNQIPRKEHISQRVWRIVIWLIAFWMLVLVVVLIVGCGQAEKKDSKSAVDVDTSRPAKVLLMPDDFPSVVMKCDGRGHMVYVTSQNTDKPPQLFVLDDPYCPGGKNG